jgi:squalene-hopene/tetraprenyl-beta-curcumene cyclase
MFDGGMGYDPATDRDYADMSNTYIAVDALAYTDYVQATKRVQFGASEDLALLAKLRQLREESARTHHSTLNWDRAIAFVSRCQNLPETDDNPWVSPHPDDRGGFIYHPGRNMAGQRVTDDGRKYTRSYGSISYAGVLSLLYAGVGKDDPRVQGAVDWIKKHYTLDENPGMGQQSLYYYYLTMAKALTAHGEKLLDLPGGQSVDWRSDLMGRLVSLQRIDPKTGLGYWVNDTGRFWENDAVLTTAYAALTLEICLEGAAPFEVREDAQDGLKRVLPTERHLP